jgi:hypothetical protein
MMSNCCNHDAGLVDVQPGRRQFLKLATLGAGVTLLFGANPAAASGGTEALLLSCMDYRLVDDFVKFMDSKGLTNKYDHVVLAGASAGAAHETFKDWHATFWSHLQVAIDLHKIHKVMVIDHRDCGAYKIAIGADHVKDPVVEFGAHAKIITALAGMIKEKHPELAFEAYLMAIDGTVEAVPV